MPYGQKSARRRNDAQLNELLKRFVDAGAQPYPAQPAFRTSGSRRKLKLRSTKLLLACVAGLCVAFVLAVMIYGL